MAVDRRNLEILIKQYKVPKLNYNLLKCLLLQNKTKESRNLIESVYHSFYEVPKIKDTGKYPSERFLNKCTINYFNNSLIETLNIIEENKNNRQIIYNYIIEYYKWLISYLSKDGIVGYEVLIKKVNEMINTYNKEIRKNENVSIIKEKLVKSIITEMTKNYLDSIYIIKEKGINKTSIIKVLQENNIEKNKILYINSINKDYKNLTSYKFIIIDNVEILSKCNKDKLLNIYEEVYWEDVQVIILSNKKLSEIYKSEIVDLRLLINSKYGIYF